MKYTKYIICFFAIAAVCSCSLQSRLRKADKYFENGEYYAAAELYRKNQTKIPSKTQKPLKAEVNFKIGECYFKMADYARSMRYYTSAIKYRYPDSIVFLNLAKAQLSQGKYSEAERNFHLYLYAYPKNISARQGEYAAQNAKLLKSQKSRYKVKEAKEFNSKRNSDFSLVYADSDCSEVVFTSNRQPKNKKVSSITGFYTNSLFMCKKNNAGKWEQVSQLEDITSEYDEGVPSIPSDGKSLYFTRCLDNNEAAQIYKSSRAGGEWTEPVLITLFPDTSISVAHPAISPDGGTLYFVSDAPGGVGGKDIWVSEYIDGAWAAPFNLGNEINTEGNEMFPYVRSDGALFFSSDGRAGLGGLDIFMAVKDSTGAWSIENLYSPINSEYDDFGICFNSQGEEGYFSSNRNQKKPKDRLYHFDLPPLKFTIQGVVVDQNGTPIPDATIRLIGNNGNNVKSRSKKDGTFKFDLQKDADYVMLASGRGYLNASHSLNTHNLADSKIYDNTFVLSSISRPIQMDNIFYEFGKWTLTKDSEAGLQQLVKILNDNPHIIIELAAHTDHVGNDKSNFELSQKRAQSVVDYLIKAGIDKERLVAKGYGETQPMEVTPELSKKYKFLKVGTVLTEEYIQTLPKEQAETCKQINRRTEFKVLKTTYKLF